MTIKWKDEDEAAAGAAELMEIDLPWGHPLPQNFRVKPKLYVWLLDCADYQYQLMNEGLTG